MSGEDAHAGAGRPAAGADTKGPAGDRKGAPERSGDRAVPCPFCGSEDTELMSLFGSSALTSQFYCRGCRTAFEQIKWGGKTRWHRE